MAMTKEEKEKRREEKKEAKKIEGEYKTGYPCATKIVSMEDLPTTGGFILPNWNQTVSYRATAWAYLNRNDGGLLVYSNGIAYKL